MRKPVLPNVPVGDAVARRLRDFGRDVLQWIDSGTRTQDYPSTVPVSGDLIEVVKSDGVRYSADASLLGSGNSSSAKLGPMDVYEALPASPDSWNLEARNMTTADLSAYGWTVRLQNSPYTVQTYAGAIPDSESTAAGNTYYASLIGGVLVCSFSASVQIHKATSGVHTYKSHVWNSEFSSGALGDSNYLFIADGSAQWSTSDNFYYVGNELDHFVELSRIGGVNSVLNGYPTISEFYSELYKYVWSDNAGNVGNRALLRSGRIAVKRQTRSISLTPTYAGVWAINSGKQFVFIDYLRRTSLHEMP